MSTICLALLLIIVQINAQVLPQPGDIVINEFMQNPLPGGVEWIEIYNTKNYALNITGCFIDDAPGGGNPVMVITI